MLLVMGAAGRAYRPSIYNSSGDSGLESVLQEGGILLVTYKTYCNKYEILSGSSGDKWDYVQKKVVMTGTPLTNDLSDIYSLIEFVQPGLLGDVAKFQEEYAIPINLGQFSDSSQSNKKNYLKALKRFRKKIYPHMLRRNKSVVLESGDLTSKKHEVIIWLRLTEFQQRIELHTRLYKLYGPESRKAATPFILTMLSQSICNGPSILLNTCEDKENGSLIRKFARKIIESSDIDAQKYKEITNSCKIIFFLDLLEEIFHKDNQPSKDRKRVKVLIFSQSIAMLDNIQNSLKVVLDESNVFRIDGSMNKDVRDTSVQKFNLIDGPAIFLLSAKVGGEGLNLTAATRVIVVDPSWNISDDNQIADRVYRIGQNSDVMIYRLFTCDTIEEHTYKTQLIKGTLAQAIIEGRVYAPLVEMQDDKVLKLPKHGFNSSKTQEHLRRVLGDKFEFDIKHRLFLKRHSLVAGVTNQNLVFSRKEIALDDFSLDESSDEEDIEGDLEDVHDVNKNKDMSQKNDNIVSLHRFEIPKNKAGVIIGPSGDTIRKIRISSATNIKVQEIEPGSCYKTVEITGTLQGFKKAKGIIMDLISKAGVIIGPSGDTIRKIRISSATNIKVQEIEPGSCYKTVEITEDLLSVPENKIGLFIKAEKKFKITGR
ncbi:hypothetical protein ACP4OV_013635 [Aristida adscensionis]